MIPDNKETRNLPSELSDHRQQYVNDKPQPEKKISDVKLSSTTENSFTTKSNSDFNQNSMTVTRTTFFSPSLQNLATNDVQFTSDHLLKPVDESILVRAYHYQKNSKNIVSTRPNFLIKDTR